MSEITSINKEDVLAYHAQFPAGKIGSSITKPLATLRDTILAYNPGVGHICEEIMAAREKVYQYTGKGNLVAVVSNGSAVLGYGHIGPWAAKPVMEAKAMFLKRFADIDAFDIEINSSDSEVIIQTIQAIAPTFGAINLEDIKAPECFQIEEQLIATLDIPVMHDDQHATAIVAAAALLNALLIVDKEIAQLQIVCSGAGAAALATARLLITLGANPEHIVICDRKGVIHRDRALLEPLKAPFATNRPLRTLRDAMVGADLFIGLSVGNILMAEDVKKMAKDPIVFALANPIPEIAYATVMEARSDVVFATGRGDYPNQVNNALVFPYLFRGALDVEASTINSAMHQAAVKAIQQLAQEETLPSIVNGSPIHFGKSYLLPKVMDPRLLPRIAAAVAQAAMATGVARKSIANWAGYQKTLLERIAPIERYKESG